MGENHTSYKENAREYLQNTLSENAQLAKKGPWDLRPDNEVTWIMDYFDQVAKYSNATESDLHEAAQLCLSMWRANTSKQVERIEAISERLKSEFAIQQLQNLPQPKSQPSESDQVKSIQDKLEETLWKISGDSERIHVSLDDLESFVHSSATLGEIKQFADLVYREFTTRKNWNDQNPDGLAICAEMGKMRDEALQQNAADFQSSLQLVEDNANPSTSDNEMEPQETIPISDQICSADSAEKSNHTTNKKISKGDQCKKVIDQIIQRLKRSEERDDLRSKLQKKPSDRDIGKRAGCDYRTILGKGKNSLPLRSVIDTAFKLVDLFKVDEAIQLLDCMRTHMQDNGDLTDEGWGALTRVHKWKTRS